MQATLETSSIHKLHSRVAVATFGTKMLASNSLAASFSQMAPASFCGTIAFRPFYRRKSELTIRYLRCTGWSGTKLDSLASSFALIFFKIVSHLIEFFFLVTEVEDQPTRNLKNIPWNPLYCVLQQDEQAFTAYCSEELSVSLV